MLFRFMQSRAMVTSIEITGGKTTFNHSTTEIIVPERLLSMPSVVADPVLHREAVAICERQLKQSRWVS